MTNRTLGEVYGPLMEITDQEEADVAFGELVAHAMELWGKPQEETERMMRSNLGYWAGYYSSETRERVERLYKCSHPVFGSIAQHGEPTPEEALQKGIELGRQT